MRKAYVVTGIMVVACFILAAACALFLFWDRIESAAQARRPAPLQTRILPDGTVIMLNAVELKSSLRFHYSIPGAASGSDPFANGYSVVSDEHGCWMRQWSESRGSQGTGPGRWLWFDLEAPPEIRNVTVEAFPRRGEKVILTLFEDDIGRDEDSERLFVEFSVPNPDPGPHPTWEAKPLPVTQQTGDLTFTLTDLRTGVDQIGESVEPDQRPLTQASFRITERGRPSRFWAPVRIVISDATGNRLFYDLSNRRSSEATYKNGGAQVSLLKMLCAEEVWKLGVEFARTSDYRSPSEALWTVPDVSIPGENKIDFSDKSAVRMGREVRLVGIGGTGTLQWQPDASVGGYWKAVVKARVSSLHGASSLSLIATDKRGRRFTGVSQGYEDIGGNNGREFTFYFNDLPDDVKALNLTFAIHESHYAEFLAKPVAP